MDQVTDIYKKIKEINSFAVRELSRSTDPKYVNLRKNTSKLLTELETEYHRFIRELQSLK